MGRERELTLVEQALASARLGRSSHLVIRGEPGIGKTALLEHAVANAGGMKVLSAGGVEFEADMPFAGLHQLLRPALSALDRLAPGHAAALRSSLGVGPRIEADRLIVGAALLDLVSALAETAPLLIAVDDAHWLDRASAETLAFAARRLVADPVAVIVALRSDEESALLHSGFDELALEGLDRDAATRLLRVDATEEMSNEHLDRVLAVSAGNPLALIELARGGAQISTAAQQDLPVGTSVERTYLRRAEHLSDATRDVLLLLAASGEISLVRRARDAAASDVEAVGIVRRRGDEVEFVHPLARAAIYHAASPAERRAAHRTIAEAMTEPQDADRRAWHLAAAAGGWDVAAAGALEQAATRARESSAYDAAAAALAEAARLTEDGELRGRRLYEAAENAWLAGRGERAVELLGAARKLAGDTADIDNLAGHIAMRRGEIDDGLRMMTAAADATAKTERLKATRILADAAIATYAVGRPQRYLLTAEKALSLLRRGDPPEPAIVARVAYGCLAVMAGRGSAGPDRLREALPLFKQVRDDAMDPFLVMCAGLAGLFLREAEAGRELLDRALTQAREHAPAAALPPILFLLGRDAAATDRWPLARARYEESIRVARETTQNTWLSGAIAGLAWLDALEGRDEECRSHAAEAIALADRYGMGFYKAWALIALGQLELGLSNPAAALARFEECSALLDAIAIDDPDLSPAPDIVDALVRLGRSDEARDVATAYERGAEEKGQPFALARAARARALVSDDRHYDGAFAQALAHHERTADIFERARTELYYGERLRRSRRRVDARKHLREALKSFERLGAGAWSERAVKELTASGETARVRDDRYRRQLTPQELQVALTLAEGVTTREAAARLYLSPKTVEYHLRHVYDKLEIRSREELATALRPRDHAALID